MSDYYPIIIAVASIAGAIIAVRVFSTLWQPVDRSLNGDKLVLARKIRVPELEGASVVIHLKSGTAIDGATLLGYCSNHADAPYHFKQLLMAQLADGRTVFVRIEEIEYLEATETRKSS